VTNGLTEWSMSGPCRMYSPISEQDEAIVPSERAGGVVMLFLDGVELREGLWKRVGNAEGS
jgi:hypothetical protein